MSDQTSILPSSTLSFYNQLYFLCAGLFFIYYALQKQQVPLLQFKTILTIGQTVLRLLSIMQAMHLCHSRDHSMSSSTSRLCMAVLLVTVYLQKDQILSWSNHLKLIKIPTTQAMTGRIKAVVIFLLSVTLLAKYSKIINNLRSHLYFRLILVLVHHSVLKMNNNKYKMRGL